MTNNPNTETNSSRAASTPPGVGTALVLAPGGLPGVEAHVGAWAALRAAEIKISAVYGCSAGAVVGSIIAAGYTADEGLEIVQDLETGDLVKKRFAAWLRIRHAASILDPAPIKRILSTLLPEHFNELVLPLTVSATEIPSGTPVVFNGGADERSGCVVTVPEAVLASMSMPLFWPPVDLNGVRYVDGGVADSIVMPSELDSYERVFVIDLVDDDRAGETRNALGIGRWAISQLIAREARETFFRNWLKSNVEWIKIDVTGYSTLEFSAQHKLVCEARDTVSRALASIDIPF